MIFPEKIELAIQTKVQKPGGAIDTVIVNRTVQGVVTFLNSERVINILGGTALLDSRFRIYLSPYGEPIPAKSVSLSWRDFTNLTVEGLIEPHYLRGRLHHYECVART